MKIYIDRIPEEGLKLHETCQPSVLDLGRADIKFSERINLFAYVTKGINNISVELRIEAPMHLNCSRCLEEFTIALSRKANLNFPIEDKNELDLTENLREEILLSLPLKPLCRSDCRGLCLVCGGNLNQKGCKCQAKHREPFSSRLFSKSGQNGSC